MKLANTSSFLFRRPNTFSRAGRIHRGSPHSDLASSVKSGRAPNRLIARWHVCPETSRLECVWSLEAANFEDQPYRKTRRRRSLRRLLADRVRARSLMSNFMTWPQGARHE
jgi:hypothetical protein